MAPSPPPPTHTNVMFPSLLIRPRAVYMNDNDLLTTDAPNPFKKDDNFLFQQPGYCVAFLSRGSLSLSHFSLSREKFSGSGKKSGHHQYKFLLDFVSGLPRLDIDRAMAAGLCLRRDNAVVIPEQRT